MTTPEARLARLEERVDNIAADVERLDAELGHAGNQATVRGRLHVLENYNAAAKAAEAAMEATKSAQAAVATGRDRRLAMMIAAGNLVIVAIGVIIAAVLQHH